MRTRGCATEPASPPTSEQQLHSSDTAAQQQEEQDEADADGAAGISSRYANDTIDAAATASSGNTTAGYTIATAAGIAETTAAAAPQQLQSTTATAVAAAAARSGKWSIVSTALAVQLLTSDLATAALLTTHISPRVRSLFLIVSSTSLCHLPMGMLMPTLESLASMALHDMQRTIDAVRSELAATRTALLESEERRAQAELFTALLTLPRCSGGSGSSKAAGGVAS